jgi:hypothetical protein
MSSALVPPGYQTVMLGQAFCLEDLGAFIPLENNSAEGALFLVRLDFADFPSSEALAQLERAYLEAEVEMWPGYDHIVFADLSQPAVFLAWQKGLAWLPIIAGLLATVILPPLLGSLIWRLLPQSLKDLISGIIDLGMMLMMMWLMTTLMKPLLSTTQEKTRKVKATPQHPETLEEEKI